MKVCIIGASITSLTLAKALVNQNIYIDLLTENKNYRPDLSRTIGISKSNIDFFNKNIININKIIWRLNKIEIFSENLKKEKLLHFDDGKEIFSILKNFKLFDLLNKTLLKSKFFKKIYFKKKISNLEKYDLIINTDSSSSITKKFFSKKIVKKYYSTAYTTIIKHEKISNDTATQIFSKKGPLAFLPISETQTSIVFSLTDLSSKKKENISELINQYNFKYKIKGITKIKSFKLKSMILKSYFHDNILAFGDLLHRIHPLAGQGFNMTIRDINILLKIIKKRHDLGLHLDKSVNYEFQKLTRHKNLIFSTGVDFVYEFFNLEKKIKNDSLSKSVKFLGEIPAVKNLFTQIADKGIVI